MRRQNYEVLVGVLLVIVAVLARFLPHPPNFSPILAASLFAGSVVTSRRLAFAAPLIAVFISDFYFGFYEGISFVYLSYAVVVALGMWARPSRFGTVALSALGSSVVFFILSNLGVWLFSGLYEGTWAGLVNCFIMALPFFHATLVSTLTVSLILFAVYARVRRVPSAVRVLR
jgi:hypothetical protein